MSHNKRQRLTDSILNKWRERRFWFVRFIDGDKRNLNITNLVWIHLADVLQHRDYIIDWDCDLTSHERSLLQDESWISGLRLTREDTPTSQTSSQPASA